MLMNFHLKDWKKFWLCLGKQDGKEKDFCIETPQISDHQDTWLFSNGTTNTVGSWKWHPTRNKKNQPMLSPFFGVWLEIQPQTVPMKYTDKNIKETTLTLSQAA